jgi:acetyl esterase/lipase
MRRYPGRRTAALLGLGGLAGLAVWFFWPSSGLRDLVYATPDGIPLTLDLDFPDPPQSRASVILFLPPDGEWPPAFKRDVRCRGFYERLLKHGYAVATAHYRLPGKYHFPASVHDGKRAVRWLRANADGFGLDARRVGVFGFSQGAYGACMLGTTGPEDGFEGADDNSDRSSRVQAVVCLGTPGDFSQRRWPDRLETTYLRPFLGASYADDPARYERASPGAYASSDDPPFLLFHSRGDLVVPVAMARALAERLRRAGVSVTLVEEDEIEHSWTGPRLERALQMTLQFFDQHLRSE